MTGERALHVNDWDTINQMAEQTAQRLLDAHAYKYRGVIESLIEDTLKMTAFQLPADVLLRVTMVDVRDIVMGAVYEIDVRHGKVSA